MIHAVIAWSARHRWLVIVLAAVAVAFSAFTMRQMPLDAIPDLADTQVILLARWDRSPDVLERQVTYPIVTSLLGAPKVKAVRGLTDFGYSTVYVVFEDGTDLYWARARVVEQLGRIQARLPAGVQVELGPDASSLGWVFQYALVDKTGQQTSDALRSLQDWFLRFAVQSVPGVAEVASVGGHERQYQVDVNPTALTAHGLALDDVVRAVRAGNADVGGRLVEWSGREYMVRGQGRAQSVADIEQIVLHAQNGTPVVLSEVAHVALGPAMRRGVTDLNGQGDVVSGIVVMRQGENALQVIDRVKARLAELSASLPPGVEIVTTYDRSGLIRDAIHTVTDKLLEEMLIVSLVILLFLWHFPSAIVPVVTIPLSVILAFLPLAAMGVTVNIMSLAGIAISIGVLVDGAIVEVENAYKKLQLWQAAGKPGDFHQVRLKALQEVAPSVFFSLLLIAVAFLPVFTLVDQEGRLFKPLAWSKNLAMAIAALLAVTLDPALRMLFTRMEPFTFRPRFLARIASALLVGTYHAEEKHPISRILQRLYEGPCRFVVRHAWATVVVATLLVLATVPVYLRLGHEFMPPLHEGTILYMPSSLPGMSVAEAERALQSQDRVLRKFPEVAQVFGKAGRAQTATDPAPLSMVETTVLLKPASEWRHHDRWWSTRVPTWAQPPFRALWPDRLTHEELVAEMDTALQMPGMTNAWTMPIKARLDMLSTGIRTPVGLKVSGSDLAEIGRLSEEAERVLRDVPGTRSVFAERVTGGWFLDVQLKRDALARYGLTVDDANALVMTAIGGSDEGTVLDGRARYPIQVRYARGFREDLDAMRRLRVTLPMPAEDGARAEVPLGELADLRKTVGPAMIRDENGLLTGYVYVDLDTAQTDVGTYMAAARQVVAQHVHPKPGHTLQWSGQFENMERVRERLTWILPLTLLLIFGLLLANTKSAGKAALVMAAVPFSAIGAVWLLYLLGYNLSMAVWVGVIALMGLDAETGVFMLLFLDLARDEAREAGQLETRGDLVEAIIHGAVRRVRPKAMTVAAAFMGLLPILWSTGAGADVMKRIAAPMVGGLVTSFVLELLVYPAVYYLMHQREVRAA